MDLATINARRLMAGKWANRYGLNTALVCAVAHHESNGWYQWATRYEPGFYERYVQPLINGGQVHTMTEATARATSWGLLQIMGQTARELGFGGKSLAELCDPDTGLDYGCRKLQRCVQNHPGNVRAALLEYNGGSNPGYPDDVMQWLKIYDVQSGGSS